MLSMPPTDTSEWLEADGLGGFAFGTVSGLRTRRYHALLLTATTPPGGRVVLLNGFDAWVQTPRGMFALSSQRYTPGVVHPDGARCITAFESEPWPRWRFRLADGTGVEQEIFAAAGASTVVVSWRMLDPEPVTKLLLRPFLSGRDYHSLHHQNPAFRFDADVAGERVVWQPYGSSLPSVIAVSNGVYAHEPVWYRNFLYEEEQARGLDCVEDLASPGIFHWDLSRGDAVWILTAGGHQHPVLELKIDARQAAQRLRASERERRAGFPSRLHRSADAYLVRRNSGKTIVAGYPWFTDWGRDTFIALRGLCLATRRLQEAREILIEWSGTLSEGMLPNRFPDQGSAPEFNAVDASLWYVIAVRDFLGTVGASGTPLSARHRETLRSAVDAILTGYANGTRYGIHMDDDGLLAAGEPGLQLTWMDAKVGDWVVTPRVGKPVEVQALWLNALHFGGRFAKRWQEAFVRGRAAFRERFWNSEGGYLYDVVDVDHCRGTTDGRFRPNQIFAAGGLPISLLPEAQARAVVDAVEVRLWIPLGLRSLAPGEPGYVGHYEGGVRDRDSSYHQGTAWPWLLGPFVEAWVRSRGSSAGAKREARARFLTPLLSHVDHAGLGHIGEIADGDPPHTPRGCPFQAWSVGELLRLDLVVLAEDQPQQPIIRN
jgi:predicted glycogen debranching enzyme